MTTATSEKRKVGSPSEIGGDSVLSLTLRYTFLFIVDAFALIIVYALYATGNNGLATTFAIATIGANVIIFVPSLSPLRWMLPGLVLVTCFVIFPIFYTVSTAFTNYNNAGNLLAKAQTITLITSSRDAFYAPETANIYQWTIFQSESDPEQLALWLTRTNDAGESEVAFAPVDAPIQDLEGVDPEPPATFDGYRLLSRAETVPFLQVVEREIFGTGDDTVGIANAGNAARPLLERLVYEDDIDAIVNQQTGVAFYGNEEIGRFVATEIEVTYEEDTGRLIAANGDASFEPNESGIYQESNVHNPTGSNYSRFTVPYRYDTTDDVLISPASNARLEPNEDGIITVPLNAQLTPGYRVWVGTANFEQVVEDNFNASAFETEDENFFQQLSNAFAGELLPIVLWTFAFAFLSVFTTFWFGLFMALIFNDAKIPGKKIIQSLLIIPYAIPGVIGIVIWQGMLNGNSGVVALFLADVFNDGNNIYPFLNPWAARLSVLVVNLWLGYPYMMLICSGALQAIPSDIYEAAAVDGASPFDRFWNITLPLLLVTVGPLLIASFVFNFNNYLIIEALTGGDPVFPTATNVGQTDILISYVFKLAFDSESADYGYASAITIVIFFITAAITMLQYRYTKTWEEVGENV